jgi:uncharacterized protein YecT (DUF1311 family)
MKMFLITLLSIAPAFAHAGAQETLNQIQQVRKACMAQSTSHVGDDDCQDVAGTKLDQLLNSVYQNALQGTEAPRAIALRDAERAWLKYRDAQINYITVSFTGGNGGGLAASSASNDMTAARIADLLNN